jgi:hypothetical protein
MKSLKSPRERLLQKFSHKRRLLPSEIKGLTGGQSALDELLAEGAVRKLDAFYLSGYEPSVSTEKARITKLLETKPKLFPASFLLRRMNRMLKPLARSAIAELVDERTVLELPLHGKSELLYIHRRHVPGGEPAQEIVAREAVEERILSAYRDGSTTRQRRSIPIAELVQRSGLAASEVRSWILRIGIPSRRVQLDEGDWAYANEDERAAAIEQGGRKRLYIAIEP